MTQARAYFPASAITRSSLCARLTRAAHAGAALLLLALAATAVAQTRFSASAGFDQDPAVYNARDQVTASIDMRGDIDDIGNIAFTSTLPAGVTFVSAPLPDQCNGTVTSTANSFSLTGGSFAADSGCSVIVRLMAAPTSETTYTLATSTFTYTYIDGSPTSQGVSGDFTVEGGVPPGFGDSLPEDGRVGVSYFYGIDVSGSPPIGITVSGLPPGLTYESDGNEIVGRPTKVGTYLVTVNATNGFAPDASATYTIHILPGILSASKSFSPSPSLSGETTQMMITLTNTANASLVGFSDPFPVGLTAIHPGTSAQCGGTLTVTSNSLSYFGNLATPGSCTITVAVAGTVTSDRTIINTTSPISYNDGSSIPGVSGALDVRTGVPPTITSGRPPDGTVGSAYQFGLSADGTSIIVFNVSGLPPGLSYDGASHSIVGVPTKPGSYSGTITAQNAFPPAAIEPFTIVIGNPPLAIVTGTLPPISGGQPVSAPVIAQGGVPPYTFTLLSGQLPPGLAFDPSGVLSGVPTLPGVYQFTAQVTDSVGTQATRAYTITIAKGTPLFAFNVAPDPAVAGEVVVATATLTGGTGAAGGNVQVWLAHTGERCPVTPGDAPVAAKTLTAALGAGSDVKFMFGDLGIDHYQVCATYAGDVRYNPVSAGPYDLFVIKGALLGAPTVAIAAPAAVKARQLVSAKVAVNAPAQSTLAPSGSVLLRANGVAVGTLALSGGVATFNTTAPGTPGTLTLTASYLGDGAFPPALSAPAVVAVTKADPAEAVPVPMLSAAALAMLALALVALGMVFRRRRCGG